MLLNTFFLYFKNLSKIWLLFLFYFCFFCIFFSSFLLFFWFYRIYSVPNAVVLQTPQLSLMNLVDKDFNLNFIYTYAISYSSFVDVQLYYIFFLIFIIFIHIVISIKHIFADYIRDIEIVSYQIYFLLFFFLLGIFFCNNGVMLYLGFSEWFNYLFLTWKFCVFMLLFNIIQLIYIYILINNFKTQMLKFLIKNLIFISLYVVIYFWLFT